MTMRRLVMVLAWVVAAGMLPAATAPFTLPPGAAVVESADGKGWQVNGTLPLAFQPAQKRLAVAASAAGWRHLHTIELGRNRVLEAWSRGAEELTVMVWRIVAGRSGFSYGVSAKARDKDAGSASAAGKSESDRRKR